MTKPRPPLSIDAALARIAGQLPRGWPEMGEAVGRSESTVRAWGDHDRREDIPLPCAITLDIAHRRAGGEGRPLFEAYALLVEIGDELAFADEIELARRACVLVRESGQAVEALVLATLPDATPRAREHALRELEDVSRVVTGAIAVLAGGTARAPPDTS